CALPSSSFFTLPPTTYIFTLSLHDALPISFCSINFDIPGVGLAWRQTFHFQLHGDLFSANFNLRAERRIVPSVAYSSASFTVGSDRKSTRLNSSHVKISYAVFCLKKKRRHP